ncbi:GerAB/ArcD/ProY family transporter [Scopulibacillus cellulosilyticus]|uniref:GerAB/ArcD/ProY family transporter n=1 Tax=Scopulibacillus cellulosilyticus TaxID=2665665 RepID=A0ABW2PY34_9BACL
MTTITNLKVSETSKVSPFLTFFLINSMQIGVSILGFVRYIASFAGYDAWIAIIISGLSTHIILLFIYKIIERGGGNDIISIHESLFGKWLGGLLTIGVLCYFFIYVVTILRTYVEVVQIWMFPQLSTWVLSVLILLLAYSFIKGGFRTVTGICFLSFIYGSGFFLTLYFPLQDAHFSNLLPIFDHSILSIFKASRQMLLGFLGFELIFIYYPFIKRQDQSKKWAHAAIMFTTFVYLITSLFAFIYFNEKQLSHMPWSTLSLWKVVKLPIIERFEYFGITIWFFSILPNICLGIWSVSRGIKRQFSIRQKTVLPFLLFLVLIINCLFKNRIVIDNLNKSVSMAGLYLIYLYIPFLFIYQWINLKVKKSVKYWFYVKCWGRSNSSYSLT